MSSEIPKGLCKIDVMILDTLLDDIESFESILRDLNSKDFTYLTWGKVDYFSRTDVMDGLRRLLVDGYLRALEQTEDGLERKDLNDVDMGEVDEYYFELTIKGRELALSFEWKG